MQGLDSKRRNEDVATAANHGRGIGLDNPRTLQLAAMEDQANRRPQVRETAQLQEKLNAPNTTGMSDELKISHTFRRLTALAQQFGDADHHLARLAALER